jgi:hypothetical protein
MAQHGSAESHSTEGKDDPTITRRSLWPEPRTRRDERVAAC